jgi:NAD(P)-dependent dehydrogenase (short-subunit alcohol dehydrogenase family)
MIDQGTGGAIAMVASVSGVYGAPRHAAYGAAKAGVMSLARTMTNEWGRHGIRVNAVAPDMIATPRLRETMAPAGHDFEAAAQASAMPLGRAGQPEDIAGPLVFLCSDLGSFVAGQTNHRRCGNARGVPPLRHRDLDVTLALYETVKVPSMPRA